MTLKPSAHTDKLSSQDIKHVQELAVKAYNRGNPDNGHGIVLFTRLKDRSWFFYAWKNTLRDPQSEEPGAIALDRYGNVWIADGGNSYDGAKQWRLIHKHCVFLVINPAAGTEVEYFCSHKATAALAEIPVSDQPYVAMAKTVSENLE